jgi:vacuolar-type H+-ATPase subunit H
VNDNTALGHLLQIESEAAALVNEAQAEADRRLAEGEQENRAAYEARYRCEAEKLETWFQAEKEKTQSRFKQELASCLRELDAMEVNTKRFCACLESFVDGNSGEASFGDE